MQRTPPNYHRSKSGNRRRRALRSVCAGVLAAALVHAAPVHAATLLIEGAGDGHGVGMSQYGARGYARRGLSYQAILAHYYSGTTIGPAAPKAVVRVLVGSRVLKLPLERYVRGVVSAEMPAEWPLASLEAQAVASRTYALASHAGGSRFDVYADTRSQVYAGAAAETPQTNAAVAATAGQILLYKGHPAATYFFASSGGMTENIENAWPGSTPAAWLRGVADPYDTSPFSRWHVSMGFATAAARLRGLVKGSFRGIEVLSRGVSPRIISALVLGSAGTTQVHGTELAERLGLVSTWLYFSVSSGTGTRREPDLSHHAAAPPPASQPPLAAPAAATPVVDGPQGGVRAPGGQPAAGINGGTGAG